MKVEEVFDIFMWQYAAALLVYRVFKTASNGVMIL